MRKRHPNHRRVKVHRSYTVEEIAGLFGIHKNTVRAWVKAGLPTCDNKRPVLILGRDLIAFLQARRAKNKQPCRLEKSTASDVAARNLLPVTWRIICLSPRRLEI